MDRARVIEMIAAACHEQNRTWCYAHGDASQPMWSEAPQWQRESAIKGVENALIDPSPGRSHERWLQEKRVTGWKWGAVKDVEKKEHPCMVAYAELPEVEREKDRLFIEMVQELGKAAGLVMVKTAEE